MNYEISNLRVVREGLKLSIKDMAQRMGITQASVEKIEADYNSTCVTMLKKYCEALGVELVIEIMDKGGRVHKMP